MLERLGSWAARRPEPRLWISVAGAGCLMAVTGLLAIAGDAQVDDSGDVGSSTPGILIFLLVVVAGYLLMHFVRETPAATAGVTAVVLGLPPLAYFLTFDENSNPPLSIEAVLGLPALVWLVSYLVGPGRGRPLLLAAGLIFGWLFALQVLEDPVGRGSLDPPLVEDDAFGGPFDDSADGSFDDELEDEFGTDDGFEDEFGTDNGFEDEFGTDNGFEDEFETDDQFGAGEEPSWTTIGVVSLLFGAGYFLAARQLDRRGYAGTATPFVVAGHVALPFGLAYLADTLEVAGTGVAFVIAGGLIAWLGAASGRRLTTIVGALEMIFGLYLVVGDAMEESSATSVGTALFVLGAVIVALAHLLHVITGETPQSAAGASRFSGRPRPGAPGPWGPGAGGAAPWGPGASAAPYPGGAAPYPGGPYGAAPAGPGDGGAPPSGAPPVGGGPPLAGRPGQYPSPPPPPPAPGGSAF